MRLIIIVKGELPPKDKMDQELQTYLSLNTYLKYDDPFFMERLRYALPHKKNVVVPGSRISQAIIDHSESVGKDQSNGVKPNHLPPLPLLTDREKQKIHVILPPDIEMSLTPTSSASSTAPFFPNSPKWDDCVWIQLWICRLIMKHIMCSVCLITCLEVQSSLFGTKFLDETYF